MTNNNETFLLLAEPLCGVQFSLEFHGAFSKCSTFAMSIFYSIVTAVQPGLPELALCPPHHTALSFLPALCYFSHKNIFYRHNLDVREIVFYTLRLSYFLYISSESSLSLSSKICHPCKAWSCYQPETVCAEWKGLSPQIETDRVWHAII